MNPSDIRDNLVAELAAHSIRVAGDGNVVLISRGKSETLQIAHAIDVLKSKARENAQFLAGVWDKLVAAVNTKGRYPSNPATQRLFVVISFEGSPKLRLCLFASLHLLVK